MQKTTVITLLTLSIFLVPLIHPTYEDSSGYAALMQMEQNELPESVIRLHIVAAGTTQQDERVALALRDEISSHYAAVFSSFSSPQEACMYLQEHHEALEQTINAMLVLLDDEKDYDAAVCLGTYDAAKETYGDLTLPAGRYSTLRVVLGEGKGDEWWGVLYPPLCFSNVYQEQTAAQPHTPAQDDSPAELEVRWRILEWLGLE